jgi:hypothetical protein
VVCCETCAKENTRESHSERAAREEKQARKQSESLRSQLSGKVSKEWLDLPLTKKHADELGETRYFNGELCSRGHLSPSYANGHRCCECSQQDLQDWRESEKGKDYSTNAAKARWADQEQREKSIQARREWAKNNPERLRELKRADYYRNWSKNRERSVKRWRERYQSDPAFKLRCTLARRIHHVLKDQNADKTKRSLDYLGCSPAELKAHLEGKFQEGMSWDNYGQFGWHVDHIKPCSSFDLSNESEASQCFHYSNLQPMWWRENIIKGDKWEEEDTDRVVMEIADQDIDC